MPTCPAITAPLPTRARARDSRLRHDNHVLADVAVVRHVHQVVELCAAPYARLSQRAPIDRRIRADLNVVINHQRSLLRKRRIRARLRIAHISKSIRAQHHACVNHDPIADRCSRINHHSRINAAMCSQCARPRRSPLPPRCAFRHPPPRSYQSRHADRRSPRSRSSPLRRSPPSRESIRIQSWDAATSPLAQTTASAGLPQSPRSKYSLRSPRPSPSSEPPRPRNS